ISDGDTFMWWAHEKAKTIEGGRTRVSVMLSGYTNSQKYSWLNNLVLVLESDFDPTTLQIKSTGYEWKETQYRHSIDISARISCIPIDPFLPRIQRMMVRDNQLHQHTKISSIVVFRYATRKMMRLPT